MLIFSLTQLSHKKMLFKLMRNHLKSMHQIRRQGTESNIAEWYSVPGASYSLSHLHLHNTVRRISQSSAGGDPGNRPCVSEVTASGSRTVSCPLDPEDRHRARVTPGLSMQVGSEEVRETTTLLTPPSSYRVPLGKSLNLLSFSLLLK